MSIIGTYSVSGYEETTHTNEYSTIDELLLQIQDNNTNEINAENIRNSVYTVWNKYIRGTNYIVAKANGTFIENAAEVITLYDEVKLMTPNGLPLSTTNRFAIFLPPGKYDFGSDIFITNSSYIDFISLSGKADVDIITTNPIALSIRANDIYIKGINVGTRKVSLEGDYPLVVCENCEGGDGSFNSTSKLSSTFINCIGGEKSFGYNCSITGIFKNCVASNDSFGYRGAAVGMSIQNAVFENCIAGNKSFGYGSVGNIEGVTGCTFSNCTAGDSSFVVNVKGIDSTFKNCTGGDYCFGSNTSTTRGIYDNCVAGIRSFGYLASGYYRNCKAGADSFGKIAGNLYFCMMSGSEFQFAVGGSGRAYGSVDASRFYGFNAPVASITDLEGYFLTTITDDFALAGGTYSFVNGLLVSFTPSV